MNEENVLQRFEYSFYVLPKNISGLWVIYDPIM